MEEMDEEMAEEIEAEEEGEEKLNRSMDFEQFRQIIENNEDETKNKASQAR